MMNGYSLAKVQLLKRFFYVELRELCTHSNLLIDNTCPAFSRKISYSKLRIVCSILL